MKLFNTIIAKRSFRSLGSKGCGTSEGREILIKAAPLSPYTEVQNSYFTIKDKGYNTRFDIYVNSSY